VEKKRVEAGRGRGRAITQPFCISHTYSGELEGNVREVHLNNEQDTIRWALTSHRMFTTESLYKHCFFFWNHGCHNGGNVKLKVAFKSKKLHVVNLPK
jgi:hypothetical protein